MFDLTETDRLLTTTRAVRRRLDLDRPVEPEVVMDCLRIAIQAPTASNGQGWRWMVVTDPTKRAALADLYREAGLGYLDHARQHEPDPQTARVYAGAFELANQLERVPVLVIAAEHDYFSREDMLQFAHALPKGRFHLFAGTHHGLPLEAPERFNPVVLKFLEGR